MRDDLIEVVPEQKRARLGLRGQLLGAARGSMGLMFRTPHGLVEVVHDEGGVVASGDGVPTTTIASRAPNIFELKRGIGGRVGDIEIAVIRPRFGLRRRDRAVLIDGEGVTWRSDYRSSRHFDLRRRGDESVVYRLDGGTRLLAANAAPAEAALALAIGQSGVVETSSLVNFLTPG